MPSETQHTISSNPEKSKTLLISGVQKALQASMGVFSMGRQEVESVINRMIDRGELTEIDGRKILSNLFDLPRKGVEQVNEKVGGIVDDSIGGALNMLNAPTRSDLQTLSEKINELAEKVDELSRRVAS